jgi:hypothetical protein
MLEHSVLNMNDQFSGLEEWDEEGIGHRTQNLFNLAANVWPRPVEGDSQS